jgi:hypothetical protein
MLSRRGVLLAQGGYYLTTGLVPFVSRAAFEAVTGPKREWWLVQTVGGLVSVIGGALLADAARQRDNAELLGVAAGSAAVLAAIDVVYVAKGRISSRYLLDAATEVALLGGLAATSSPQSRGAIRRLTRPSSSISAATSSPGSSAT